MRARRTMSVCVVALAGGQAGGAGAAAGGVRGKGNAACSASVSVSVSASLVLTERGRPLDEKRRTDSSLSSWKCTRGVDGMLCARVCSECANESSASEDDEADLRLGFRGCRRSVINHAKMWIIFCSPVHWRG